MSCTHYKNCDACTAQEYKIIRQYKDDRPSRTIKKGLTLDEAQAHCQDPATSTEEYFDGYDYA